MNIFYLDADPTTAARAHGDKHCVKMILETAQLLSTAHHVLDGDAAPAGLYKPTHKNHPSAVWVRESADHYAWAYRLFVSLCEEYTARYGKTHLTETKLRDTLRDAPASIAAAGWCEPPQCMPEQYHTDCTVSAYRAYYLGAKREIVTYAHSDAPGWFA